MYQVVLPTESPSWQTKTSEWKGNIHRIAVPDDWPNEMVFEDSLSLWVRPAQHNQPGTGQLRVDSRQNLAGASIQHGESYWVLQPHDRMAHRFVAELTADAVEELLRPPVSQEPPTPDDGD